MNAIITWLEAIFGAIPLPLLEVWGRFSYFLGFALAICAFGGFTFRPGGRWGFGRERQAWDAKAFLCIPLTFVLITISGYLGSFIVLVPGAQTFESLKDLVVFLCIVLFGYPALITVPFAYGFSDLIEGVPPDFLADWLPGYFINPSCFWVAYQLFGKNPDFRRARTWSRYLLFVLIFMGIEPVLWGYICSGKFTSGISYRNITPALFFTTTITWIMAPFVMLGALPLARSFGLFWAEIAGHVKERALGRKEWVWETGKGETRPDAGAAVQGLPIRMLILTPFIALVLIMVGATAFVTLRSAEDDANKLAAQLHQEISENINLRLDDYLARSQEVEDSARLNDINGLLKNLPISEHGRAFIIDQSGKTIASSGDDGDPVVGNAIAGLYQTLGSLQNLKADIQYRFDHVTAKPLSRETWLTQATAYQDRRGGHVDWILITAMPEAFYLAGVRTGNSRSAMVFAIALLLSLTIAALLASVVAVPLRRISQATQALAGGDLKQRVPSSRLEELDALTQSFNNMAEQLKKSFDDLLNEVETRKRRERELEESEARVRTSENRLQLAIRAAKLSIWDWDVEKDQLIWDDSMYQLYGVCKDEFGGDFEAWSKCLVPEDVARATDDVEAALRGDREFASEFRVLWSDGSIHFIKGVAQTIRGEDGRALRMVGINWDVTEQLMAEHELRKHKNHLEELVAERTADLSVAVGQAEAANRAKSAFLANMSHEIRTPMNAILGYAQMLQRERSLSEPQKHKIEAIHRSGNHLLTLINDILEMSKIEAGRTTLIIEPFNLHALLEDVKLMFVELAFAKGIDLTIELDDRPPRAIEGDAGRVRQVVINLLSNAVKFTEKGQIRVRASSNLIAQDRCTVTIAVEDTGTGIKPNDLTRIFNAFDQSDTGVRSGGTGLGLTISRNFARLMGGDLTVESALGEGSVFKFSFEAGAASVVEAPKKSAGPMPVGLEPNQARPKALIVDDVATNRELLNEMLSSIGFETRVVAGGEEALDMQDGWRPDLVLMDLLMPGMGGLEATRRLRANGSKAVIVVITASAMSETEQEALAVGADGFLRKPYHERELLAKIGDLLGVRYVYETDERLAPSAADPLAEVRELSRIVAKLPPDLIKELRDAAIQARAGRLVRLAESAAEHSEAAATQIRALAENFQYDILLAALE